MDDAQFDVTAVSERLGVSAAVVRRYTRLGVVVPRAGRRRDPRYSVADLARLRKALRLTRDLGLNGTGVAVVLRLLDEIEALQREVAELRWRA